MISAMSQATTITGIEVTVRKGLESEVKGGQPAPRWRAVAELRLIGPGATGDMMVMVADTVPGVLRDVAMWLDAQGVTL